jgi:ribosomal protein S18 acetylase RimI-like enzyme
MKIEEITNYDIEIKIAIDNFLKLLVDKPMFISELLLKELVTSDNSHLFFAIDENDHYMGMLTMGIYLSPTGKKGWIEDLVVSDKYRGQGVGENLTQFAIQFSQQKQVGLLMLTSNPARVAANNLYNKLGFEKKESNVYKMTF